jgi:hypothetical protein
MPEVDVLPEAPGLARAVARRFVRQAALAVAEALSAVGRWRNPLAPSVLNVDAAAQLAGRAAG